MTTPARSPSANRKIFLERGLAPAVEAGKPCEGSAAIRDADDALSPATEVDPELTEASARETAPELPVPLDPRLIRFRSARASAADWHRRSGSFSRVFITAPLNPGGNDGFNSAGGAGFLSRIAWKMTADVGPSNGSRPVAIW